jgi:hypothetical protein
MRSMLAAALALLISQAARAEDTAAPVVEHTPVTSTASGAKAVQVFAKITDESKFFPQIFFRYDAGPYEKPVDMKPVKGSKNQFGGNIPIKGDSVEYYVEAYDEYGNGPGRAADPDHPFKVDTSGGQAVAKAPPPPPKPAAEAPPPVRRTEPAVAVQQSGGRTWTWIAGGVGLGLLAGGLVGGLAVKTADTAYNHRLAAQGNDAATLKEQYDANKSLGTKATVLTIAGGVLLAGSVALYFLEAPPPSDERGRPGRNSGGSGLQGSVVPLQGGGALALQGSF